MASSNMQILQSLWNSIVNGLRLSIEFVKCNTYILNLKHVNITLLSSINVFPHYENDAFAIPIYILKWYCIWMWT
jgi:hypothetical protein